MKTKEIEQLIEACKELAAKRNLSREKTEALKRMAVLARQGEKDSEEFKSLDRKYPPNQVIDSTDVVERICRIVRKL